MTRDVINPQWVHTAHVAPISHTLGRTKLLCSVKSFKLTATPHCLSSGQGMGAAVGSVGCIPSITAADTQSDSQSVSRPAPESCQGWHVTIQPPKWSGHASLTVQAALERTTQVRDSPSANATLLGCMGEFSCIETNQTGQGQPTLSPSADTAWTPREEGGTEDFCIHPISSHHPEKPQRVAAVDTCAVPITDKSPFTATRTIPKATQPQVSFHAQAAPVPHFQLPQGWDALTVAAADGASLCRCHAALSWPFGRGPS